MRSLLLALALVFATPAVSHADVGEMDQAGAVTLNVVVRASGAISVDGHDVKDETELADRAREAVRKSPDVRAVIQADRTVVYGRVMAVMDALKRGGITKIAFAVTTP